LDFNVARHDGVAVASVEEQANHLHLAPDSRQITLTDCDKGLTITLG